MSDDAEDLKCFQKQFFDSLDQRLKKVEIIENELLSTIDRRLEKVETVCEKLSLKLIEGNGGESIITRVALLERDVKVVKSHNKNKFALTICVITAVFSLVTSVIIAAITVK